MRALKAILTACGNLRRQLDWPEDQIGLRALGDVNLPKFTTNDIPLYKGITNDLFPGVELPKPDYSILKSAMEESCKTLNLQPKHEFMFKCIQLYETILVRHGLMLVGGAYSGKTCVIKVLQHAMSSIKDNPEFNKVLCHYINPKSILQTQLYGDMNKDTNEWTDGVLAIKIRDCAESTTPDRKWVIFDGPVDAVWIENMNTVLDDNKKLCLNSGQIIKLSPQMTLMFEVEDLQEASPATVSRCGMVLLEPRELGHNVLIRSYFNSITKFIDEKIVKKIEAMFEYVADMCVEFTNKHARFPVVTGPNFLIHNMINVFDCQVRDWDDEENKGPKDAEEICQNAIIFAAIWGIGGQINEDTRPAFDKFLSELIVGEEVCEKYKFDQEIEPMKIPNKLGDFTSLFEVAFKRDQCQWQHWTKTIPAYVPPKECTYAEVIVPTLDSIRINFLLNQLLMNSKHTLIVGATGTGKSVIIQNELKRNFENDNWTYQTLAFSAQTSANDTQDVIDSKMDRRRMGFYAPKLGKEGVIFVDDLNMPKKEKYGAQPPIELLRQWMDYGGWYELVGDKEFRHTTNVRFCAAMGPPGGGRQPITNRYVRHYNVLYVPPYQNSSLSIIFSNIMEWMFMNAKKVQYPKSVTAMKDSIVSVTIHTYQEISAQFRPTPAKSHYIYNLRDVSKVFQGICKADARSIRNDEDMIKIWAHECTRVFADRLISIADREDFRDLLKKKIKEKFKKEWDKLVQVQPLLFASFCPTIHPDGNKDKKPINDLYCELTNRDGVFKVANESLDSFNIMFRSKKMDLVLFTDAIEHIVKIHRIITTQFGHALLVGVGGSGRKSLTELATFIANYEIMVLEMSKGYDFVQWRDDLKNKLFMNCGLVQTNMVFLFSDTQIINEAFVEDINNILNNGEVPNLYNSEDLANIYDTIVTDNKNNPAFKSIAEDTNAVLQHYTNQAKNSLHVVLAMSPIGDDFKRRLRMFPSLVACCTIDWFLPWPNEALYSVADHFLSEVDDLGNKEGIVTICVDMQERVHNLSNKYLAELKRYYYITPTSYLILIKTFMSLLQEKRNLLDTNIFKFEKGLTQLEHAQAQVKILSDNLADLIPKLKEQAEASAKMQAELQIQTKQVDKEKEACMEQEAIANAEFEKVKKIRDVCDIALDKVMPIYHTAMKAVKGLKSSDVTELKNFSRATPPVAKVAEALCIMFNKQAKKIRGQTAAEGTTYDYWDTCKKQLLNAKLLGELQKYDRDNVNPEHVIKLRPILESEEFTDSKLSNASTAAFGIGKWVRAIVDYDEAMKIVRPKQQELKEAEKEQAACQKVVEEAQARLNAVKEQLQALMEKFEVTKAKEEQLKQEKESCQHKLEVANTLINSLKDERENWKISLAKSKQDKRNLTGDILLCSGIIAYLGVFIKSYREECIQSWMSMLKKYQIDCSEDLSLEATLGNKVKIREWQIQGLPQDSFSADNAVILDNSDRWSLMIDPQMQANIWLKNRYKEHEYKTVKPTMDINQMIRVLRNAIQFGNPVIFEDAIETFDPMFDPLLGKQVEKKGNEMLIKFGEQLITFHEDFKFFITTKMSRPHFSPELCVKVTMLNFMVTPDGLQDQLITAVIKIEAFKQYEKKNLSIMAQAGYAKTIAELQDKILNLVSDANPDTILENQSLKSSLEESNEKQKSIEQSLEEQKQQMAQINKTSDAFIPLAVRAQRLFFVLDKLVNVDPMYQYSLDYFRNIYEVAIKSVDDEEYPKKKIVSHERRKYFIDEFTLRLYRNVCRSLFEKDKLLYSFLITLEVMDQDKIDAAMNEKKKVNAPIESINTDELGLNKKEVRFLMSGATRVTFNKPNPSGENGWLLDTQWAAIEEISDTLDTFKGFDDDVERYLSDWEKLYNDTNPQNDENLAAWPDKWAKLEYLQKILIMRIIRPDKVVDMIINLVVKQMGQDFVSPPAFDLKEIHEDSTNHQPIIIVLSPGADPMTEIMSLKRKIPGNISLEPLSLGQGQGPKAVEAIRRANKEGNWVVLQNCHLAPSFLPTLEGLINEIQKDEQSHFRMWLTTMPSDQFPVTIVQNGVKVIIEPPKGLKNNLRKSYMSIDDKTLEHPTKPSQFRRLLWGLCFFNAVILERRKFGPLGWNIPYEFSASDLAISKKQLAEFLEHFDQVPFEALTYMVAEANYGGRVTQAQDRVTIAIILTDFYNPAMINEEKHKLSESGSYYVPPDGSKADYLQFIQEEVPFNDLTEIFGMHENADITAAVNNTNALLSTCLSLQPRDAGGEGKSQEEVLDDQAKDILGKMPEPFVFEDVVKKHPYDYNNSMNTVLHQEILRFNKLLVVIRSSLKMISQAIKGEVVMSVELEEVGNSIFDNQIPEMWKRTSYPSLKGLAGYVFDFVERLKFIQEWIDNGQPSSFWISGFYFTHSFMTGLKQNYARKYVVPIDQIQFDFQVISDTKKTDTSVPAEDGGYIFGLFLEGCRWDSGLEVLAESYPKKLFTKMPHIWLLPKKLEDINYGHSYVCPVYMTVERRGTLSTTGHSTNFILDIMLPMQRRHDTKHWIKRGVAMITQLND